MLIAQITDMHVTVPGRRADEVYDTAGRLARWVARLNAHEPRPDLVLATGDLVNEGEAAEYARLARILGELEIPLYLAAGNHDDRDNLRAAFPEHGYLAADDEFLHYVIEDWPLRIIVLDTLIPGEVGGRLCARRLDWLAARLAEAPARPTLIALHHPPFRTGVPVMDALGLEDAEAFAEVIAPHANVLRVVAGHLHRAINGTVAGRPVSTAPATAHQLGLTFEARDRPMITAEPPAAHLHLWLGEEGGLITHTIHLDAPEIPR